MNAPARFTLARFRRSALTAAILLAVPLTGVAQSAPASSASAAAMEMTAMPGVDHDDMAAMHHDPQQMQGSMPEMNMGAMQGGSAPPDARSPDYSDGVGYGSMKGMDMADNALIGMLLIDQLEAFHGRNGNGQSWEAEGWYGRDENKLWLRSEGERSADKVQDGDVEVFWNHSISTYWSTQLGARHDLGTGPARDWAAFGVQGLAPYWFELEATGYVGPAGRSSARFRADYEVLFTQRLILQPELEANLYGKNDPALRIGSGLSDVQFGLRLRYEIRRQFAPYIGVNWVRRTGITADYARADGKHTLDRQILAGFRIWF
jgi:copper resistance protein B